MSRVYIVYHHFPHYRAPVMRALAQSQENSYSFFGAKEDIDGIKCFRGDDLVEIHSIGLRLRGTGKMSLLSYGNIFDGGPDVIIIIGNPNIRQTWWIAIRARLKGIKVAFWTHGWLRPEPFLKARLRNIYFALANRVLVYGSRAVGLAQQSGFSADRIDVIWNSLDWELQSEKFHARSEIPVSYFRRALGLPQDALVVTTISRITQICRYDLLVEAAAILQKRRSKPIVIDMVGSGPALDSIKARAAELDVMLICSGAIYDEDVIADHLMASDVVVSPGKVGLTAMHALAYGVPTVTHNDLDRQMPEVEAIVEGQSGAFFEYGSVEGLADAIESLERQSLSIKARRARCRNVLEGRFTPNAQRAAIDCAIGRIINGN